MNESEMKALDGKQAETEVMVISTGDALYNWQHEQWLAGGFLAKKDRKWHVTHKETWTWKLHYTHLGGGYMTLVKENYQIVPVN